MGDMVLCFPDPCEPLACSLQTVSCHPPQPSSRLQRAALSKFSPLHREAYGQGWLPGHCCPAQGNAKGPLQFRATGPAGLS